MKKIIYYLVILNVFLFSCKKENKPNVNAKYAVSFNVSGFSKSTAAFSVLKKLTTEKSDALASRNLSLSTEIAGLIYAVYDSNGNYLHAITQTASQAGFGTFNDNLQSGNYTICIMGYLNSSQGGQLEGYASTLSTADIVFDYAPLGEIVPFVDTYISKFTITVSSSSPSNHSVVLNRIDGKLEVDIEDAIPANAATLNLKISKEYYSYNLGRMVPDSGINAPHTQTLTYGLNAVPEIGQTNVTWGGIVLNTVDPFMVTITCLDSKSNIIAYKTISNVYCQVNNVTILSGDLFGGSTGNSTGGFTVKVDSAWNNLQDTVDFSRKIPLGNSLKRQ